MRQGAADRPSSELTLRDPVTYTWANRPAGLPSAAAPPTKPRRGLTTKALFLMRSDEGCYRLLACSAPHQEDIFFDFWLPFRC